jgi:hypothetical protein
VLGELTAGQAQELATARRGSAPALALILSEDERSVAASAQALTAAGWRVAVVTDAARLPAAWQELHRGLAGGGAVVGSSAAASNAAASNTAASNAAASNAAASSDDSTTVAGAAVGGTAVAGGA